MRRAFRIAKLVLLVVGLLLLLAIPVSGLVSTAANWEGVCSDTAGGQWQCPWWEYASSEMFWSIFIFIPFLFVATLVFLGMSLLQFLASLVEKRRRKQAG